MPLFNSEKEGSALAHGKTLTEWLYHKKWFILALVLMLLAVWGIFSYLGMAQKPIASINIAPAANADKWRFSLSDGTEVLPDASGDMPRAAEYIRALGGEFCAEPAIYTDHPLINALISSCAQKAKLLEADFEASVQVPKEIGIEDTDLAVLLSNMIDNALEATAEVSDKKTAESI